MSDARIQWVDRAKGWAILLIVMSHVWHKLWKMQLDVPPDLYHGLDAFFYSFHVPVFFFISGLFLTRSLQKHSLGDFIKSRAALLLYPYLVWSVLQTGVEVVAMPRADILPEFLRILYWPRAHFWFLYDLFIFTVVAAVLMKKQPRFGAWIFTALAMVLYSTYRSIDSVLINDLARNGIYFAGGLLLAVPLLNRSRERVSRLLVLALVVLFVLTAGWMIQQDLHIMLPGQAGLAFFGVLAVIAVSMVKPRFPWLDPSGPGRQSLVIYVAHVLAAFGVMDVLQKLGVGMPWPLWFLTGTLAGVILPLLLYRISNTLHMPWLFRIK